LDEIPLIFSKPVKNRISRNTKKNRMAIAYILSISAMLSHPFKNFNLSGSFPESISDF